MLSHSPETFLSLFYMMEAKPPPRLLILLPLLLSHILAAAAAAALSPTPPPMPPPSPPTTAPHSSTLDPKQLAALQSIGVPTAHDPCATPSPHNATACDAATPFRHLITLRLANCSADVSISPTATRALSTLRSLSFLHCPIPPPHHLPPSLTSFSATSSLRRLTGVYLSRLHNLSSLTILDVPIAASGPWIILSGMPHLRSLTVSNANLSGGVPRHWHAAGLVTVDLSANRLTGAIPSSISLLSSLTTLNLSSNTLTGAIPDAIGDAVAITTVDFSNNSLSGPIPDSVSGLSVLTHLDLSSNRFNGSIPPSLSEMAELRHLNLKDNDLQGVLPFNASFIKRLEVFKVGGNGNLCYNRTVLSAKMGLGIAPCDKYGLPVSPPPDRATHAESPSDDDEEEEGGGGSGGGRKDGGGHGRNWVVLGVAIALSCFVFLVIFIVCISKMCR